MSRTETERLTESPGVMQVLANGANYYSGEQIITHLNYAIGPTRWDWHPVDHGYDREADEVWVLGRLTARFVVDAMNDEGYVLETVVKEDRGWQPINRKRDGGAMSIGNDYKGADTDALKRCARLLGVGLDAWEKSAPGEQSNRPATSRGNAAPSDRGGDSINVRVNADGDPICQQDRDGEMCGGLVAPWEAKGDYAARDAFWVAGWQIKQPQFGLPLCLGHQQAIKSGSVKPAVWHEPSREERIEAYSRLANEAISLGHRSANALSSTDPATLADDVLAESTRKLRAWIKAQPRGAAA